MFSGKTTELMRRLKRYTFAQYRCLIIRYLKDTRYSEDCIASHDGQTLSAVSCTNLYEVTESVDRFDVIGIDEGQFVSARVLVTCCIFLAEGEKHESLSSLSLIHI